MLRCPGLVLVAHLFQATLVRLLATPVTRIGVPERFAAVRVLATIFASRPVVLCSRNILLTRENRDQREENGTEQLGDESEVVCLVKGLDKFLAARIGFPAVAVTHGGRGLGGRAAGLCRPGSEDLNLLPE